MRGSSIARVIGAGVGAIALAVVVGGVAGASNGHAHGTLPPGIGVIVLTATSVPSGCTALIGDTIVPTKGNAVIHTNANKTGAWFTETLTGSAELVSSTGTVLAWGHETSWDGGALNQLFTPGKTVIVTSFTANFQGRMATGAAVNIHGNGSSTSIDATVTLIVTTKNPTTSTLTITTPGRVVSRHFNAHC